MSQGGQQPAARGERIAGLDGVRGIAILAVMVFHFSAMSQLPSSTWLDSAVTNVAGAGWAGVDLFFVLSGFLITGILYDAAQSPHNFFRHFYARRALRIFPLYFGFLAVLLLLLPLVRSMDTPDFRELRRNQFWFWTYLTNIWMAGRPWFRNDLYATGHLWSLAIEEQFYVVWPAVVFWLNRRQLMAVSLGAIVFAFALRIAMWQFDARPTSTYVLTPSRVDALAVGALIALCVRDAGDRALLLRCLWPVAAVSGAVVITLAAIQGGLDPYESWVQCAGFTALALLFGGLIAAEVTASLPALHAIVALPALRTVGRYSYGMYVLHWPVATWLTSNTGLADWPPVMLGSHLPGKLLYGAVAAAATFATAWLSWQLFESQFLKLKDRFPYAPARAPEADALPPPP
jgi:peptidoglycan/LPS O-acetylase OafA/YrhL